MISTSLVAGHIGSSKQLLQTNEFCTRALFPVDLACVPAFYQEYNGAESP